MVGNPDLEVGLVDARDKPGRPPMLATGAELVENRPLLKTEWVEVTTIAGLRAQEQGRPAHLRLYEDPDAITLAGAHGRILAERFCLVAPQLQPMVAARTKHLDELLSRVGSGGGRCQIINIGAGLDSRICRVDLPEGSRFFDLDLPSMLRRRADLLAAIPMTNSVSRIEVPIDLRQHDVAGMVMATGAFDPAMPTLVAWEGGSMYFDEQDAAGICRSVVTLLGHPDSRFWMDYVHQSVIDGTSGQLVVSRFTNAMRCLGEPFINGFVDIGRHFESLGLAVVEDTPPNLYSRSSDPVFDLYRFCVARKT